jgi:hypothetical protein
MANTVKKHRAKNCPADMSSLGPDMSGPARIYPEKGGIRPVHVETFLSTLILEQRGTKLDESWRQGSPRHNEQVPKEVFLKSKDFPSNFG